MAPPADDRSGVKLLYFAWLRAKIGVAEEIVALPPGIGDVAGLLGWLRGRGGGYGEALRDLALIRVAVNQDHAGRDHEVRAGDEVALFPPMTGG
jgi:molybdopterin synthase sulfur carrier subunit